MILGSILDWLLERIGLIVFVLIFVSQIVRALLRTRREQPPTVAKPDELEARRREQEIQEDIRRRRAARRAAESGDAPPPPLRTEPPPERTVPRPETTQLPDPFGGPLRRVFQELEREFRTEPPAAPARPVALPPPPLPGLAHDRRLAEVERQEQLAEQVRTIEETRVTAQRRAAHAATERATEARSEGHLRTTARGKLLDELRDPASLRRAFVLREVLGPPVGLR